MTNTVSAYDQRLATLDPVEKNVRAQTLRGADVDFVELVTAITQRHRSNNDPSSVISMRDGPHCYISWRTLLAGSSGSNLISGGKARADIDRALAAATVTGRLGAKVVTGVKSDDVQPVERGTWSASWYDENETVTSSDASIDGRRVTPRRLAVLATVSRQLMAQRDSFNQFVRDRLIDALARGLDEAALQGDGVKEPRGLQNHPNIPVITAGAAFTVSTLEDMENSLLGYNVPVESWKAVVGTATRAKIRQKSVDAGSGTFVLSVTGNSSDFRESLMGIPATTTTLADSDTVYIGDWSRLMLNLWGDGFVVTVDPYKRKAEGLIEIYAQALADVTVTQPNAFVMCQDAAL